MERVRIEVVRSGAYRSTDGFHVYTDGGSGAINWGHPATARRMLFWEDVPPIAGHLLGGHLTAQHLDGRMPDRNGGQTWLLDEHLRPAGAVAWESEPHVFGRFRYAVVTEDAAGNAATAGVIVHEVVINSEPAPAANLRPVSYSALDGRLLLRFEASAKLVG